MSRGLQTVLILIALLLVPLLLGLFVVGRAPPSGRTTVSATRVGHKALHQVLGRLGYRVRRFERGLERPPVESGVFVALEPGPFLFRENGRYAKRLLEWVDQGNAALLTLGPDPDRAAEVDDRGALFGATARQAVAGARRVERAARARSEGAPPRHSPSGDGQSGDSGRTTREGIEDASGAWSPSLLTTWLGLDIGRDRLRDVKATDGCPLTGPLADEGGAKLYLTRPRVWTTDHAQGQVRPLLFACGSPIVLAVERLRGRLLLLSEPRLLQNGRLASGAHAVVGVRAIEHLAAATGADLVFFEEFSHGGREVANVFELATSTRARWPVTQLLLVVLVWIVGSAARRRAPVPYEHVSRRSRDEVLGAMVTLQLRAADLAGATHRLIDLCRRRLRIQLGLAAGADNVALAAAVGRRTGRSPDEIARLLSPEGVGTAESFVRRSRELQALSLCVTARTLGTGRSET